jgi:hypothetical protein
MNGSEKKKDLKNNLNIIILITKIIFGFFLKYFRLFSKKFWIMEKYLSFWDIIVLAAYFVLVLGASVYVLK